MESMPRWPDALMISKMLAEELGDPIAHAKVLNLGPSQPPQSPQAGGFAELLQELPGDSLPGLPPGLPQLPAALAGLPRQRQPLAIGTTAAGTS